MVIAPMWLPPLYLLLHCLILPLVAGHIDTGRQFNASTQLVSRMTRKAIDLLKRDFKEDLTRADWLLVVRLKSMFGII